MVLEVQNQQSQPLQLVHVSGIAAAKTGGHSGSIATGLHHPPPPEELQEPSHRSISRQEEGKKRKSWKQKYAMSRRNGPKLDLKLNLSPPRVNRARVESPGRSSTSPPSSCVSSELINPDESLVHSNSPEATSMVLVGCPRCLMYVMLAEEDPKCPKCKSTVLLDVIDQKNTTSSKKTKKS